MPGPNHSPGPSSSRRARRSRAARNRDIHRADTAHGELGLDIHVPLPIVRQGELGSAATLSTLARHRMSRQQDHDPLGMTVQQAVEQLGEHNDNLNAALQEPLPEMVEETRNQESGEPRRKRRKRDRDPVERREIPRYGIEGRVIPGRLQMQVLTCDGGEHRITNRDSLQVENILLDDESTYCSESPKCNIVLKHCGETPFALTRLVIKNPRKADNFSSRLQEGLVFVSMGVDDLQFRTERYDLVKDPAISPSPQSSVSRSPHGRTQRRRPSFRDVLHELGHDGFRHRASSRDRISHEWYENYRVVHAGEELPAPFRAAQAIQAGQESLDNAEARLRELVRRNDAMLRHNSWQQIEPDGGTSRISMAAPSQSESTESPTSPDDAFTPSFQGFDVTVTNDVSETYLRDTGAELRRRSARAVQEANRTRDDPTVRRVRGTLLDYAHDSSRHHEPELTLHEFLSEEDDRTRPSASATLPSMRMEPNEEHPMYGDGARIRRASRRRHGGRLTQPRKIEWIPNKIKRPDMGRGATGDDVLKPHAHFFIKKGKDSVALDFSPPVSGRYILFKLWAPPGKDDIDVQSIAAYGYAGTRLFRTMEMR